jgi:hypothetical protein
MKSHFRYTISTKSPRHEGLYGRENNDQNHFRHSDD